MEFRFPTAAAEANSSALKYLTKGLRDPKAGEETVKDLFEELGNSIYSFPEWHPILTLPSSGQEESASSLSDIMAYKRIDHTEYFVKGFVTCPYDEEVANNLVTNVNKIYGLHARRLNTPLYNDNAYPVVVQCLLIELEADGTIRGRDALAWCVQTLVKDARNAQVGETWWNMRSNLLGTPNGSRSSLIVNQHTGGHMRKILETLNNSGMFGPVREWSLEMFSEKRRKTISKTLIRAAIKNWVAPNDSFEFELRGEICKAEVSDTWKDGSELSVRVMIGGFDLSASGYYYPEKDLLQVNDPNGKKALAEKFL